jgi:MFS family permease
VTGEPQQTATAGPVQPDEPATPLANPQFRELWTANAASNFGGQVQIVGASWLMASLTASPQLIALVQGAQNLGTVFVILMGGALADNYDRRRIMFVSQSAMLATAAALAVLTYMGLVTPALLLALTLVISAFGSINNPAWQASVRDILPRALISRAVSLNSTSINLARTAGPALGGLVVAVAGAGAAFAVNAISFVGFLLALLRWKPRKAERTTPRERILPSMLAGLRYVALAPNVRNATIRGGMSGLCASAVFSLLPVVARHDMHGDAVVFGLLLGAFGAGAVVSAYSGGWLRAKFPPDQVVRIASIGLVGGSLVLGLATNVWVAGIGAALGGGGWTLTHSTYNTTVQLSSPSWVTARALASYQTSTFIGMASGALLWGWIAEHLSTSTALLAASAGQVLAALIGLSLPLPRFDELMVEPMALMRSRPSGDDVGGGEGPVRVEIEYAVDESDWPTFAAAMDERGRIRRRDGARNWALWQDLAERRRWIESYRVATWAEYLRHIERRTEADRANHELLGKLDRGAHGPVVRRYLGRNA